MKATIGIFQRLRDFAWLSRQRAYDAVSRVLREHRRGGGYPSDWQAVTVVVPALTADLIREIERRHRRDAGLQVD